MSQQETKAIKQFIGDIARKDYSQAQASLQACVVEKIKTKVRNSIAISAKN
jgi:hypothetical protein